MNVTWPLLVSLERIGVAPKQGPKRAQNTATQIKFVCFSWFFIISMKGLGGLNYSQMANFDSQIDCNTFWMIYGTSQKSTKSGPSDPVFVTKML